MIKRLALSVLIITGIGSALTAGALAFWTTSEGGTVSIATGDADITLDVDDNCDGGPLTVDGTDGTQPIGSWTNIVPGETDTDCITINNTGDADLNIYVRTDDHTQSVAGLLSQLSFRVTTSGAGSDICPAAQPNAAQYTSNNGNRGCLIAAVPAGGSVAVELHSEFLDTNANQNAFQTETAGWKVFVDGYTN